MTEDKELLAREELLDLRHFFRRDGRDGIAFILFRVAFDEDAGGGFKSRKIFINLDYSITFDRELFYPNIINEFIIYWLEHTIIRSAVLLSVIF